mmetsp:Transcript_27843/g.36297  ORF Transcript_27843/g.36297 Transcript_27843/m.36297 type:complete len:706 (+) Transcript_27843:61-2178(+)
MRISFLSTLLLVGAWRHGHVCAMPANPEPLNYEQPDGSETPLIYLRGDARHNWMEDSKGYTVLEDTDGWYVYAKKEGGRLVSSGARVGFVNPKKMGLLPNLMDDHHKDPTDGGLLEDSSSSSLYQYARFEHSVEHRSLSPKKLLCGYKASKSKPCELKNLVILVRFKDHASRQLPDPKKYEILFNNNGPTSDNTAPTGSVNDVFLKNSYGRFKAKSTVSNWIHVSKTEKDCVDGKNGLGTKGALATWKESMEIYENGVSGLKEFDEDNDGKFDAVCMMHSGVGAEAGGKDCESKGDQKTRVWSHATAGGFFTSKEGITTNRYYISTAVWGRCPPNKANTPWDIARIAVIAHELGHFLGLPDMYDSKKGQGVGRFDLQGQCWGWKRDQYYPPMMSAWTKMQLDWVEVVDVNSSDDIRMGAACKTDKVWRITHGFPQGEYLLLENRYGCGFDVELSPKKASRYRGGLAIWHIDETGAPGVTNKSPSFPGDSNWPKLHYKVALIQCDGQWHLEKNKGQGDETDLCKHDPTKKYKKSKKLGYKIGPEGLTLNSGKILQDTTTDAYSTGKLVPTGITITAGEVAETMVVNINLGGSGRAADEDEDEDVEISQQVSSQDGEDSADKPDKDEEPAGKTNGSAPSCDNESDTIIEFIRPKKGIPSRKKCSMARKNKDIMCGLALSDADINGGASKVQDICQQECLPACGASDD